MPPRSTGKLEDARKKLDSTSDVMNRTSATTKFTLREAERANEPIDDLGSINLDLVVPADNPAVIPYHERLRALGGRCPTLRRRSLSHA